jgi:ribosomal protein S18 acetylase RimI-like enzyme
MVSLREATTEDIPSIRILAEKTWFDTYASILSRAQMEYMFEWMYSEASLWRQMTQEGHVFFVALEDTTLLGYVSVEAQANDLFHLHKLYVVPDVQKKGAGKALIQAVFRYAQTHACGSSCTVELNVNRHNKALDFYRHMGMHIHSEGDFDIGNGYFMNDYVLHIDLPAEAGSTR